ncbi:transmembrane emp24 domain-containing protein 3-like [Thalassophryne amazonica]|uniref:transmembrane emp24 domain-containing protein 3-like n=1 Tax=Thalassophryne amazonica TaxID=390379 RepID=UPI0014724EC8|nr:transmembrane emp24 domain-containing protein 3-like [Thalassophryne amazonica]
MLYVGLLCCVLLRVLVVRGTQLSFKLPDKEEQCFYEELEKGVKFWINFHVLDGGNLDVDWSVTDPLNGLVYEKKRAEHGGLFHNTTMKGVYTICFSNAFSTFTDKTVYFNIQVGEEEPLLDTMSRATALTQMESTCASIHEFLRIVSDSQMWQRQREAQDRLKAEHLLERVTYWSIGESILLFVIGFGQLMVLKSFFADKKGCVATST